MDNQQPNNGSGLMDQTPSVDTQTPAQPTKQPKRKNGFLIFVSAGMLLLFTLATVGILVYQTQQQASVGDNRSLADFPAGTNNDTPTQCTDIKLYKNNELVSVASLRKGDTVFIAIATGSATKAKFQINAQPEVEVTTASPSGEFKYQYTFPTTMTDVIIKVQRFIYGAWQ